MFSVVPLMTPSVDPDPIANFRHLISPSPDTAREAPRIDPGKMGVVAYASAKSDGERA